jgi:quinate dehydrogenase
MTSSDSKNAKVGYLFGYPIKHSLSPIVHDLVFKHLSLNYTYTLYESTSIQSFLALTKDPQFYGSAITMPYKVSIIPHLHHLTPEGLAVGAINTLFVTTNPQTGHRELHGTNTDCIGIREALRQNMPPAAFAACKGKAALIIGGGGTSRAAVYALKNWLGCNTIYMLNRDASEVEAVISECTERGIGADIIHISSLEQAKSLPTPAVIVNAIPDFPPQTDGEVLVRDCISAILDKEGGGVVVNGNGNGAVTNGAAKAERSKGTLLEMCYHPSPNTAITRLATGKGWTVVPGTEAMIWQALEQERYWTGRQVEELPVEEVKRALKAALVAMY